MAIINIQSWLLNMESADGGWLDTGETLDTALYHCSPVSHLTPGGDGGHLAHGRPGGGVLCEGGGVVVTGLCSSVGSMPDLEILRDCVDSRARPQLI